MTQIGYLFPGAQECSNDTGIMPPMKNGKHYQRTFIGCVGYQEVSDGEKSDRSRSQIRSSVAYLMEREQGANRVIDSLGHSVGSGRIIGGSEVPNFI